MHQNIDNKFLNYSRIVCINLNHIVFEAIDEWEKNVIKFIKKNPSIAEEDIKLATEDLKLKLIKEFNRWYGHEKQLKDKKHG